MIQSPLNIQSDVKARSALVKDMFPLFLLSVRMLFSRYKALYDVDVHNRHRSTTGNIQIQFVVYLFQANTLRQVAMSMAYLLIKSEDDVTLVYLMRHYGLCYYTKLFPILSSVSSY